MTTLADWRKFAKKQAARLEAGGAAPSWQGGPTDLHDFVQGEAVLESALLERAIGQFGRTLQWPPLSNSQRFYLVRRLTVGVEAISECLRAYELRRWTTLPAPPDPNRRTEFVEWLLVRV